MDEVGKGGEGGGGLGAQQPAVGVEDAAGGAESLTWKRRKAKNLTRWRKESSNLRTQAGTRRPVW